ncbi:hypothetical protein [Ichthyenterobacterium magnum]|uniref:Uncharacterized protein n=1 Tax=Ichthyenterobacterium magnum TaxID=1230530 RepID=A0A420DV27_9FLAO|nr:hypothetical protein [Ichthyenterobacterium magnum]RKE98151.1 hypothetical protein BXY80_0225 [Ichthyenterobacterium magnum]
MKTKAIALTLILITTLSCKNETTDEDISIAHNLELKLNHGKKWIANIETHEGIIKMDSIISRFKIDNENDYKVLGNQLTKQTSYVIKHCSMQGESHDQLHVVLIPMLDEISILKEENNEELVKFAFENLEQLISAYFKFFKV